MGKLVPIAVVVFLGLAVVSAGAVRTHERFSQSTYYAPSDLTYETPAKVDETPLEVEDRMKGEPQDTAPAVVNTDQSAADLIPVEATLKPEATPDSEVPERYTEYRGTSYTTTGDFVSDARPWWFNPQYASYGNPEGVNVPQRYPSNFDPRYYASFNGGRFPQGNYYPQYSQQQGNYPQYARSRSFSQFSGSNGGVPYESTGGGCPTQYWISNTQRWPDFFTVKSTVGDAFGTPATSVFGETTILQALLNTRPDGYSSLLRNGATAILNAYSRSHYKFSHVKVIESFNAALVSRQAAAQQSAMFDEANVSSYSEQYNSCA